MSLVGMVVAFTGKLENKKTALQAQARCHDRAQLVVLVETLPGALPPHRICRRYEGGNDARG